MEQLNDFFGFTGDNGQIGINRYGDYVAYDYGYTTNRSTDAQVSDINDSVYDLDARNEYIDGLYDLLDKEEEALKIYEKKFLYDENGNGTYTRYHVQYIRKAPKWMMTDYDCGTNCYYRTFEEAKKEINSYADTDEWSYLAYIIKEVTYDLDHDIIREQEIEVNLPDKYAVLWAEKH